MRPFRLARVAAEAEGVRLKGLAARIVTRLIMAVIGLMFVIGAVVFVHLAGWHWLSVDRGLSFYATTGILGGADLLIALLLLLGASRSSPSRVERDALAVRQQAVAGIGRTFDLTQLALPVVRLLLQLRRRSRRA